MTALEKLLQRARGSIGRTADQVGSYLGNPLPEMGWTERAEAAGGSVLGVEDRINKSLENTGGIAEGDYSSALRMGAPYAPSRADGGILTRPQAQQNSGAVESFLKSNGITNINTLNPVQRDQYNKLTANTGGGGGGYDINGMVEAQRSAARAAYEEAVRRAGEGFNRARGIYDEGMGLLGKRREEFEKLYGEGKDSILNRFEGERGNLQASSQNAASRSANALRALGLGGSAMIKSEGRQRQQNMQQLGDLQGQRDTNERQNDRDVGERRTWADTQETALNRRLADADEARRATEAQANLVQMGDESRIRSESNSFMQRIAEQQMALAATRGQTASYAANPLAVNMADFTDSLNTVAPNIGGVAGAGDPNAGANIQQDPAILSLIKQEQQRKLAGVLGGGLYT